MHTIKSFFINKEQQINFKHVNSYEMLSKNLNLLPNTLISFVNNHDHCKTIVFIFKKRCSKTTSLLYSKLLLHQILSRYTNEFSISNFNLSIENQPFSDYAHYYSNNYSIFYHSIIVNILDQNFSILPPNEDPKNLAINISNAFIQLFSDIKQELSLTKG